ncbi:GntR family transcriptional regulator [Bacillus sp. B15-48]|uniref:GntR family transcriptional regulator n=1 Tax=Bacillus sp. B15-48 TaxID=1548601 RepID=UPI00193FD063|nr:GntR family transcriptional regulator [Bacillus sp. B15-48]MBM4760957.1 GntR family transcriptional regulator [Bacillus sp. B15-48]
MEYFQNVYQKSSVKMKSVAVYDELKKELLTGKWKFGEKILVNELIEKFDVSRRPVMDAMKMLQSDGYIEIIPQSGCKVVDYNKKNILDQLLLSSTLESLCAELAAIYHTEEEFEYIENYFAKQQKNPEKLRDKLNYLKFTRETHFAIFMMTHSEMIKAQTIKIWNLTDFYLLNSFDYFMFDPVISLTSHGEIIQHIKARNGKLAKESMLEYTQNFIGNLRSSLP